MDLLETDPVTGKRTGLARTVRKALKAMKAADVPYSVIGATALAVRGLSRMSRDLDLVVLVDDANAAIDALRDAGLEATTPTDVGVVRRSQAGAGLAGRQGSHGATLQGGPEVRARWLPRTTDGDDRRP